MKETYTITTEVQANKDASKILQIKSKFEELGSFKFPKELLNLSDLNSDKYYKKHRNAWNNLRGLTDEIEADFHKALDVKKALDIMVEQNKQNKLN